MKLHRYCLVLFAIVLCLAAAGSGLAVCLSPGWPQTLGGEVHSSPVLGDLDGDDRLEVVVGSLDGRAYAWHGDGTAVAGWPRTMTGSGGSPALGDLGGDGKPEVVIAAGSSVYAWHGDGSPMVGWPQTMESWASGPPAIGDIDGDDRLEVVVGSAGGSVYAWHGDGTPMAGWPQTTMGSGSSPALGDLDGDGKLDVVIGSADSSVYAWHGDGIPMAGWPQRTGGPLSSPALGDLDMDGRLEVVVGSHDCRVYAWHGDGTPMAGWPQTAEGWVWSSPALGDLDGDGKLEVVIGCVGASVYAWHGDGTLVAGWPQAAGGVAHSSPALGDLDGDGKLEVVVGSLDHNVYAWHSDGTLVAGWPQVTGDSIEESSPALGDVTGDDQLEVVVGSNDTNVYAWRCDTRTTDLLAWPMFHHDMRRTGLHAPEGPDGSGTWPPVGQLVGGTPRAVAVRGSHAYVAAGEAGLQVVDLSAPAYPAQVGLYRNDSGSPSVYDVAVSGNNAFLVGGMPALEVVDVSNPTLPASVGGWMGPSIGAPAVAVSDHWAYVPLGALYVLDVADLSNPVQAGACGLPVGMYAIEASGNYAYLAGDGRLFIVDVSNPAAPALVAQWPLAWSAGCMDVAVSGNYAYVAGDGLWVLDVSDPTNPVQVGYCGTPEPAFGVGVSGNYAYVADYESGLRIVDVSNPAAPVEVAYWDTPGDARAVDMADGLVVLADYGWGLLVFPEYSPGTALLSLTKSADHGAASPGSSVTFTLNYANTGTAAADSVTLTDPLDPLFTYISSTGGGSYNASTRTVTWNLADLAAGASTSVMLTAQVSESAARGTEIQNQATISAANADPVVSVPVTITVLTVGPLRPTNFWDVSVSSLIGGDLALGVDAFGKGIDAGKIGVAGTSHQGCRYELKRTEAGDVLSIQQARGGGLEGGGDLLSFDAVVLSGAGFSGALGVSYLLDRSYAFDRAFGDTGSDPEALRQDQYILLLTLDSAVEMAVIHDPVLPAVITYLRDRLDEMAAKSYREAARTEFTGTVHGAVGEVELGSGSLGSSGGYQFGGSAPLLALFDGDLSLSLFWEDYAELTADRTYRREMGAEVAWSDQGPTLVTAPLIPAASDTGAMSYGLDLNDDWTPAGYFMESRSQDVSSALLTVSLVSGRQLRYDIPPSTFEGMVSDLAGNPVAQLAEVVPYLLGVAVGDLAQGFADAEAALKSYSAQQGDMAVAEYRRSGSGQVLVNLPVTLELGGSVGAGAHLKLGLEFQALVGQETQQEAGEIRGGELVPTIAYTSPVEYPAYPPTPQGFQDMLVRIGVGALTPIWEGFLGSLCQAWDTVEAGAGAVINAVQPGVHEVMEGATQLFVDGAAFGQTVTMYIRSAATDQAPVTFGGGSQTRPRVAIPYRVAGIACLELRDTVTPTGTPMLTLVSRVHVVTADDDSGTPVDVFPDGAITFESTATAEQLQGYGFTPDSLPLVRLYHFLPDSVSWAEVPSTQQQIENGVTITAGLSEAGEYALGIVGIQTPSALPSLVNMTPLSGQLLLGPQVHLEAVFYGTDVMDANATRMEIDGRPVAGVAAGQSDGGLLLDVSVDATLSPGPHRLKVWVADIVGRPGFASVMFYVDRENSFPDVPPDFWAWRYVEATKLAGIVTGYPDGTYQPVEPVNRAQMAVYVSRALAGGDALVPTGPATATFSDVPTDYWAFKHVEYCHDNGVVTGYWDGTYRPEEIVNRAQMAVYVSRAMAGGDAFVPDDPDGMPFFPDVAADYWAYKYVEYCHDHGVVGGYWDGTYRPEEVVNRGAMAVYVQRAFDLPM